MSKMTYTGGAAIWPANDAFSISGFYGATGATASTASFVPMTILNVRPPRPNEAWHPPEKHPNLNHRNTSTATALAAPQAMTLHRQPHAEIVLPLGHVIFVAAVFSAWCWVALHARHQRAMRPSSRRRRVRVATPDGAG